jgi:hypothetical protein
LKKTVCFVIASVIFAGIIGCEQKESIKVEQTTAGQPTGKHEEKVPVLMTGEKDQFHQNSRFESVRKSQLTNFGRASKPSPVITSDLESGNKALNSTGVVRYNVMTLENKPIDFPAYPFDYENDVNALKKLYDTHNLGSVVRSDMSEIDKLIALMVYTNQFLQGGRVPTQEEKWRITGPSAITITKLRREQGMGGTSEQYAALFCQLSLACGFNTRIISMHTLDVKGNFLTNDVCEVFLNSYDKWAVFDAYNRATYYLRNNAPQNALELRNMMLENRFREIVAQPAIGDFADFISVREKLLTRYRYIYMWRMNDILSKSGGKTLLPWQALYQGHLVWEDEKTPVAEGGFDRLDKFTNSDNPEFKLNGVRYVAHERSEFYWGINHVVINFTRTGDETIRLYLDTMTPNFDYFLMLVNGNPKKSQNIVDIQGVVGDYYVRSVNKFGAMGPFSTLTIVP